MSSSSSTPSWTASGDWFDVCKCSIPCPCEFAQTPTYGDCDGVLAYHIRKGQYGEVSLDGLNVLTIGYFKGNIWAGETKFSGAFFFDERANEKHNNRSPEDKNKPIGIITPLDFTRSQDYAGSDNNDNIEKLLEYYI